MNQEVKQKQPNMMELIVKAGAERTIEEEQLLELTNQEVKILKAETNQLIVKMEAAKSQDNEVKRREYRNEIVIKNLRLVTQVLKKYGYFSQDKFQNGCLGLLKAAETFDSSREVPFSNYACFCIETEVRLAFKRVNRAFEGKKQGFLDSLDSPAALDNGDEIDRYDSVADPFSEQEFDQLINETEVDTLFYDIIIPCIEEYGVRAKDIDMALWRQLEIQYFIELSMEQSQRQRMTLTDMAKQLNSTTQNMRIRHKKVMELIRIRCRLMGYYVEVSSNGRARVVIDVPKGSPEAIQKMQQKEKQRNSKKN